MLAGPTVIAASAVVLSGAAAPTVTAMGVERPCESNTATVAVPTPSPANERVEPVNVADTTATLPLLTVYGPTPPPIEKD